MVASRGSDGPVVHHSVEHVQRVPTDPHRHQKTARNDQGGLAMSGGAARPRLPEPGEINRVAPFVSLPHSPQRRVGSRSDALKLKTVELGNVE